MDLLVASEADGSSGSVPAPWPTFKDCHFRGDIAAALQSFGFEAPTPIQAHCWPVIVQGRDVVGVAETGSGKTLAFLAPAFQWFLNSRREKPAPPRRKGKGKGKGKGDKKGEGDWNDQYADPSCCASVLALAPTRELALQIRTEAEKLSEILGIKSCCLYGGVDFGPQIRDIRHNPELVVACPGRLWDLVERRKLSLGQCGFLILDEADRMLDMGFEEQVRAIISRVPRQRQTVMFTATWPTSVQALGEQFTWHPVRLQQGDPAKLTCNVRVQQDVVLCKTQGKKVEALVDFLRKLGEGSRTMVFVNTKAQISGICKDLKAAGFDSVALHADLDQQDRERSLQEFRAGECFLVVATDVACRGLDVRDVKAVVCFDVARDKESHVHRVGRTGRAGASGYALTLIATHSQADLRMAQQIFLFIEEAGRAVQPGLAKEVEDLLRTERSAVTGSSDAGAFVILPESSDEEFSDEDSLPLESFVPWHRRPLPTAEEARGGQAFAPLSAANVGEDHPGSSISPAGPDVGVALGNTTCLQNPVEQHFGNAAAQDIAVKVLEETVRHGCKLLTHDLTGDANSKGKGKPWRWMVLRRVPWQEIVLSSPQKALKATDPSLDHVWHVVIHELARTKAGKVRICTNYFKSNIGMVYDWLTDAFQLLEEDDPQVIQAAISDESVQQLLKMYFETGDTQNPQHFHTMAKMNLWPTGTLLHHCCESGFVKCVEYLLAHHTPQTAERHKPWLQLADPCWQDRTWKNSAFHSTAWTGQAEVMGVLMQWATDWNRASRVRNLFDKKKQTPMDLVEVRLKKAGGRGQDTNSFKATFNILARVFNKKPFDNISLQSQSQPVLGPEVVIMDREDSRQALPLPGGGLTLRSLAQVVGRMQEALDGRRVDTLLLSRIDIQPLPSEEEEARAAEELMGLARPCRRVAFVNCTAPTASAVQICRATSKQLRATLQGHPVAWDSIAFPSWSEVPAGGSMDFAEALWDLSAALRDTCPLQAVQSIQLAPGTLSGYLPSSCRSLPFILSATTLLKPIARRLLGESPTEWQDTELWKRIGSSSERFTALNPLLKGPDMLERKLLNRGALSVAEDVCGCLSAGWETYVEALGDSLILMTLSMPQWAPLVAGRPVDPGEQSLKIVRNMADEALFHLLKMRRSRSRSGGLPHLGSLVGPYVGIHTAESRAQLERNFPKALAYFKRCFKTRRAHKVGV